MADKIPSGRPHRVDAPASPRQEKEGKPRANEAKGTKPEVRSQQPLEKQTLQKERAGKPASGVKNRPRLEARAGPATADQRLAQPPQNYMFALPTELHGELAKRLDLRSWAALAQTAKAMQPGNHPGAIYAARFSSAWSTEKLQFQGNKLRRQVEVLKQSREAIQYPGQAVEDPKSKTQVDSFVNGIVKNHAHLCVPLCSANLNKWGIWSSIQAPVLNALAKHPEAKSVVLLVGQEKIPKATRAALSGFLAQQVQDREITLVTENAGAVKKGLARTPVWVFSQHKGESALTNLVLTYGSPEKAPDAKGVAACLEKHPNLRVLCLNVPGLLSDRNTDALASLRGHADLKRLVLVDANQRNFVDGAIWQRLRPALPAGFQKLEYIAQDAGVYTQGWTHIDSSADEYLDLLRPAGPDGMVMSLTGFGIAAANQLLGQIDDRTGRIRTLQLFLGVANEEERQTSLDIASACRRCAGVEKMEIILYNPDGVEASKPQFIALLRQMKTMPEKSTCP